MIETQTSCNAWADATFGPISSAARIAARANEELAELISAITMPVPDPIKIAEECADVTLILFRLADWAGEDLMPVFQIESLMAPNAIYAPATSANGMMAFVLERLSASNIAHRQTIGRLLSKITIKMVEICAASGTTLGIAIDQKMAIVRNRDWHSDGSGCGYHVPLTIPEAKEQLWVTIDEATEQLGKRSGA